jgi:hypothetical protein
MKDNATHELSVSRGAKAMPNTAALKSCNHNYSIRNPCSYATGFSFQSQRMLVPTNEGSVRICVFASADHTFPNTEILFPKMNLKLIV